MRPTWPTVLIAAAFLLAACLPTQTPVVLPTRLFSSPTPLPASSTPAATPAAATITPSGATATASTTTPAPATPSAGLEFDPSAWDWADRSPFAAGLAAEDQAALVALAAAPLYVLSLDLAADLSTVVGSASVYYTNQAADPLDHIWFHLHPNVLGGSLRVAQATLGKGEAASLAYAEENSALGVSLPSPLSPGEQVVIHFTFEVRVPIVLDRNYGVLAATDGILAL
jgi:hypothetical protein